MKHDFEELPIRVLLYFINGWYIVETYGVEIDEILSVKTYQVICFVTFDLYHHHAYNQYACDDKVLGQYTTFFTLTRPISNIAATLKLRWK